eukprot:8348912-Pyramimonas_sp.AAC.1
MLGSLSALTSLDLKDCYCPLDISELAGSLSALASLNLTDFYKVTNAGALGSLSTLTSLDLTGCQGVTDVQALGSLTALTSLNLCSCSGLEWGTQADDERLQHLCTGLTALTSLKLALCDIYHGTESSLLPPCRRPPSSLDLSTWLPGFRTACIQRDGM